MFHWRYLLCDWQKDWKNHAALGLSSQSWTTQAALWLLPTYCTQYKNGTFHLIWIQFVPVRRQTSMSYLTYLKFQVIFGLFCHISSTNGDVRHGLKGYDCSTKNTTVSAIYLSNFFFSFLGQKKFLIHDEAHFRFFEPSIEFVLSIYLKVPNRSICLVIIVENKKLDNSSADLPHLEKKT